MNTSLNNISKGHYAKRIYCGYDNAVGYDLSISSTHVRDKRNGLLGRFRISKEYLNCTSDTVLVSDRTGLVIPLYPTPEYVAERYKISPVNGRGVYAVLRFNTNGWNARHIFEYCKVFDEMEEAEKEEFFENNPILKEFYHRIQDRWLPYFSERIPARGYESLLDGEVTDDLVFFITEEDIRNQKVLYDSALDISLSFDDISHKRIYHPSVLESNSIPSEINKVIKESLNDTNQLETVRLVSFKPITMYRKIGKHIQKIVSKLPVDNEKEGLYYLGEAVDENGEEYTINETIDLNDRNRLADFYIFRTYDEARNFNSDVELTKLKTQYELETMEMKKEMTLQEAKHKEELAKIKNVELSLKIKEFVQETVHKRVMREVEHREKIETRDQAFNEKLDDRRYKLWERVMDQEERIQDREFSQQDKQADNEHKRYLKMNDLQNAELTLKLKMMELQSKMEQKQLEHNKQVSNNWVTGIMGISSIIGTFCKIFGSATGNQAISKTGTLLQALATVNPQTISQVKGMFS